MPDPFNPSSANPITVIQAQQPAQAEPKFSRTTLAKLKETANSMVESRKSMLDDMSRHPFANPGEALQSIMKLQHIQKQLDDLRGTIAGASTEGFASKDVEAINEWKRDGKSEEQIADLYDTNQSKINRLRHGKTPVDDK